MPPVSTWAHLSHDTQKVFDDIQEQLTVSDDLLVTMTKAFLDEFREGLGVYGYPMAMIPTFVTGTPDGTEKGSFLALDLGGTNLRVCEVTLNGDKTFRLRQEKYKVSEELKTGEATDLFDYLAASVDSFLTTHVPADQIPETVHLGLTFSFPVEQTALNTGKILTWTKGFAAKNAIGNDVVKLLQDAFDRKQMRVKCVALVNDTVGAMLSRAYTFGGCILGAIFGTGTNGSFLEDVAKITKLKDTPAAAKGGKMVVNTEWGAFNNTRTCLPSTPYDKVVDRRSINPGFQAFEKFISGMYLGEVTRTIILSLIDATPQPLLFNGKFTPSVNSHYGLDTSVMSAVEEAFGGDPTDTEMPPFGSWDESTLGAGLKAKLERVKAAIVKELGYKEDEVSLKDAAIVKWVSSLVATRAARMSGVAVAAVLVQTGRASFPGEPIPSSADPKEEIGVGVDGSLIQHYPRFETIVREAMRAVVGADVEGRTVIGLAKDGSGVGAALCALQALKQS